jgi:hypothetical protein
VSNGRAVTVYLDDIYVTMARRAGGGSISAGMRDIFKDYIRLATARDIARERELRSTQPVDDANPFG